MLLSFQKLLKIHMLANLDFLGFFKLKKKKNDSLSINGFFRFSHIISRKNKKIKISYIVRNSIDTKTVIINVFSNVYNIVKF